MKRLALTLSILFLIAGVSVLTFILSGGSLSLQGKKAALKITTTPEATIFLNEEHLGKSPLEKTDLTPGEYTIRASTDQQTVVRKARVSPGSWTLVTIEFGPAEGQMGGEVVSLDEGQGLVVTSTPDGAAISVDGQVRGLTPLSLRSLSTGVHSVTIAKDGYHPRTLENIKVSKERAVTIHSELVKAEAATLEAWPQSSQDAKPAERRKGEAVTILETGTGWLRVRESPSLLAAEVAKVNVGEIYNWVAEENGWVKIKLVDGKEGWVSAQFVKKGN